MNLRVKLAASFGIFIAALLLLGIWSAWNLRQLGRVSRRILAENSVSVIAAEEMNHAAEKVDSALVLLLLGQQERARSEIGKNLRVFDLAFARAAGNITEPGEAEQIERIRMLRETYGRLVNDYLGAGAGGRDRQSIYFHSLEPVFQDLHQECMKLLQLNQDAMARKSNLAASVGRRGLILTLFLAGALVLVGIGLAFFLSGRIVRPILDLKETAAKIAGGNLSTRASIISRDEVGILAAEFNRMAERVEQVRQSDLGQMLIAQQTTEVALKSLYDPVVIVDGSSRVTSLNPAAEKIFGQETNVIGRPVSEISHDARIAMAVNEALSSQQAVATESVASAITLPVNGAERAYRLQTTPMRNDEGQILGAIMLLDDVTYLREIDKLKSEFIDVAARHLQTPLRDAELAIHALLSEVAGELNDNQRDLLEASRGDCQKLEKVIHDLLTLSRIESGEMAPKPVSTDLVTFLQHLADDLKLQVEAAEIAFTARIDPSLPSLAIDAPLIREVIEQLSDNAIRCTPRGGEIQLLANIRENYVAISLTDTGCGIPLEHLPRIFNRFAHAAETPSGGTGLGLAIAKRVIEAHRGQIGVQSLVNQGTTFTITLPIAMP